MGPGALDSDPSSTCPLTGPACPLMSWASVCTLVQGSVAMCFIEHSTITQGTAFVRSSH